jgi:hypothetical protein
MKADKYAEDVAQLRAQFFRSMCPSAGELQDYHFGFLAEAQVPPIHEHVRQCPHCIHELAILNSFLAEEPQPSAETLDNSLVKRILVRIAEVVRGGQGFFAPLPAGLRGEGVEKLLRYRSGEIRIDLDLQENAAQPGLKELMGAVVGAKPVEQVVYLWHDNRLLATAVVDEDGFFTFTSLQPGRYELLYSGPESNIVVPDIEIGVH